MIGDLAAKRTEKLMDKGLEHLEAGRYSEALQVAAELEDAKDLLAFYLAGQCYSGLKDLKRAVATMRRGVLNIPATFQARPGGALS